jgi:lipopolysaccharide/colanic/teichoic acid biosynthesis glycosyltransferase
VLLAGCLLAVAHLFALAGLSIFLLDENGFVRIGFVSATVIGTLFWRGVYEPQIRRPPYLFLFQELSFAFGVTFVAQGVFTYLNSEMRMPLRILVPGSVLGIAALMAWHSLYGTVIWKSARRRVLFAGKGPLLAEAAAYLDAHPLWGLDLIGFVGAPRPEGGPATGKWMGDWQSLDEVVKATGPDIIVIGSEGRPELTLPQLLEFRAAGIRLKEDFAFIEHVCRHFPLTGLRPARLIFGDEFSVRDDRFGEVVERTMAAVAIFVLLPVLLAAAAAVRWSSRGPVLERRPRVGKDGKIFNLYRFRCTHATDRRLTAAGRLLRNWTVEEWPQLLNVLRGEMLLVGPRPEPPEFVEILARRIPFYRQRLVVRPGLTGWAQLLYTRQPEDAFERLQYDLYYIKNRSRILNNYVFLRFALHWLDRRGGSGRIS